MSAFRPFAATVIFVRLPAVAGDGAIDLAGVFARAAVDQSDVGFVDLAVVELVARVLRAICSSLATTIRPDVSLSRRWTMPTLSEPPAVAGG